MMPNQIVATRVEEHREAPRVPECDQARFSGVEIDVHSVKVRDALTRHLGPVNPRSLLRIEVYKLCEWNDVAKALGSPAH
jgi:hypothetical protein